MVAAVELLESSLARLARKDFRAMNFLELVMNLSVELVRAEVLLVKENGMLVAVTGFHVWGCSSQATPYTGCLVADLYFQT